MGDPLDLMPGIQQYQAPLRKKDLGSLIQPRRGGGGGGTSTEKLFLTAIETSRGRFSTGLFSISTLLSRVHPLLTKRPIFIVRLEARKRKKDRLGEGL